MRFIKSFIAPIIFSVVLVFSPHKGKAQKRLKKLAQWYIPENLVVENENGNFPPKILETSDGGLLYLKENNDSLVTQKVSINGQLQQKRIFPDYIIVEKVPNNLEFFKGPPKNPGIIIIDNSKVKDQPFQQEDLKDKYVNATYKLEAKGNVIPTKIPLKNPEAWRWGQEVHTSDGGRIDSKEEDDDFGYRRFKIQKTLHGNIVWSFATGDSVTGLPPKFSLTTDGGCLIWYSKAIPNPERLNNQEVTKPYSLKIRGYLLKLDLKGNKVWEKVINQDAYNEIHLTTQAADNTILIAGASADCVGINSMDCKDFKNWIKKVDAIGNFIYERENSIWLSPLNILSNGLMLIEESTKRNFAGKDSIVSTYIMLQPNGKQLWQFTLPKSSSSLFPLIQMYPDGSADLFLPDKSKKSTYVILNINSGGKEKEIYRTDINMDYISSVFPISGGGYILLGETLEKVNGNIKSRWLVQHLGKK